MMHVGQFHTLRIDRETSAGLFLSDDDGEDVLLPNKYCPASWKRNDWIDVFIYRDHQDRKIATTLKPLISLHTFAPLEVVDVTTVGAFVDWGLEKHLLIPYREQRESMVVGRRYIVYMDLDPLTDRLFGSTKFERYLSNERLTVTESQRVEVLLAARTDLGYKCIVNGKHLGLIYENEVFQKVKVGQQLTAYIKSIREDHKLDLSLQPQGYTRSNDPNVNVILNALREAGGRLPVSDKTSPDEIYRQFKMSKKAFKRAVGALYKQRHIVIGDDSITLAKQ